MLFSCLWNEKKKRGKNQYKNGFREIYENLLYIVNVTIL